MPTLDRRLLAWSDSDTEDDQLLATPTRRGPAVDDGAYDRCGAAASVDDVLVPGANHGRAAETLPAHGRGGGGGVRARPSSATRKACAAAGLGLLAVGGLCAYLAWRCGAAKLTVPS